MEFKSTTHDVGALKRAVLCNALCGQRKGFFEITEEGKKALQEEYDKQPADYTENPEFADLACPEPKDPTF